MVTRRKDLRTGTSYWESRPGPSLQCRMAPSQRFYDVIVVGAGISGALAAQAMAKDKIAVLVVDRRPPATGSTAASTALVQWEIDQPLTKLITKVGRTKALACYRASYESVQSLKRLIERYDVPADLAARETLLLAGDKMGGLSLRREAEARRAIGLPSRFLDKAGLNASFGFERAGAILSKGSLAIDPRKLTLSLLRMSQREGVEIASPVAVEKISSSPEGVFVRLDSGDVIACRKLVVATGYEVLPDLPKQKYNLISTWALATVPQNVSALWKGQCLVWEASDPYLYFRTTIDRRIIVGGEDEDFQDPRRRDALIGAKCKAILTKLANLLPEADLKPAFTWAGTFAESPTGLPVIGPVKGLDNVFAILGAGGNGITYSVTAASLARAWVQEKPHRLARLYAP